MMLRLLLILLLMLPSLAFCQTQATSSLDPIIQILKESEKHTRAEYEITLDKSSILQIKRTFKLAPTKKAFYSQEVHLKYLDPAKIEELTSGLDVPCIKIRTRNNAPKVITTTRVQANQMDEPEERKTQNTTFLAIICDPQFQPALKKAFETLLSSVRE